MDCFVFISIIGHRSAVGQGCQSRKANFTKLTTNLINIFSVYVANKQQVELKVKAKFQSMEFIFYVKALTHPHEEEVNTFCSKNTAK